MSYIAGRKYVSSGYLGHPPAGQQEQGQSGAGAEGRGGPWVVPNLYPRRPSLGQRLFDTVCVGVAWAIFIIPALLLDRQDRKAGAR